jgi:nitrogen fixation/metabolism regulation signal transduction histidine kinase
MIQKLLHNPMALKLVLLTIFCVLLFAIFAMLVHRLRRNMGAEVKAMQAQANGTSFPFATYQGVIQQLRDQGKELQRVQQERQEQASAYESISEAVLSNLSIGVVFFDRLGLVRQANRAAKSLFGYASPYSFHFRDLFRGTHKLLWQETGEEVRSLSALNHAFQETLRDGTPFPKARIDYVSPGGQKRILAVTASPVQDKNGQVLGVSCLVSDLTEMAELSQQAERNENLASLGEISAGLVNDFRKSLNLICGYAETLMREDVDEASRYYAEKILAESESLSRIVSEFLEFAGHR